MLDLLLRGVVAHERAWQANWDMTAVAHQEVVSAIDALARSEQAWMECARSQVPPPDWSCNCGDCGMRYQAAQVALEVAKERHRSTVFAFKAGIDPDHFRLHFEST